MRLLVLAAALPRIVAFATLPDERMSYSSTGCPPGLLACEDGITFATSEDMLRNAADHPEIDASLQLPKRCVPVGTYMSCMQQCPWTPGHNGHGFQTGVAFQAGLHLWMVESCHCRMPCLAHCIAYGLDYSGYLGTGDGGFGSITCEQAYVRMGEEAFCVKVRGATSPQPMDDVKYTNPPTDCCAITQYLGHSEDCAEYGEWDAETAKCKCADPANIDGQCPCAIIDGKCTWDGSYAFRHDENVGTENDACK